MTAILALDTASEFCSVTLLTEQDETSIYHSATQLAPRSHVQNILPMIKEVLSKGNLTLSQVDAIAFGRGPGSFTGLRIASGITQGLAYGQNLPVVGVSNLRAAALHVFKHQEDASRCLVMFDARMNEAYWALVTRGADGYPAVVDQERVDKPEYIAAHFSGQEALCVFGSGLVYKEALGDVGAWPVLELAPEHPAELIAELALVEFKAGRTVPADQAAPVYIRDQVTWKKLPGRE